MDTSLTLSARLALVPSVTYAQKRRATEAAGHVLPGDAEIAWELNRLNADGGVPLSRDDRGIRVYLRRHVCGLFPSARGDAWMLTFVAPLGLRDYKDLGRGVLRVRTAPGWIYCPTLPAVPSGCRNSDDELRRAWAARASGRSPAARPAHHDQFCDMLEAVIEAGQQLEEARQNAEAPIAYYAVESAGELRGTAAGVYVFRLHRRPSVRPGVLVALRDLDDLRGTVDRLDGDAMTVRFATTVDRARIPSRGELVVSSNQIVQKVQRAAVAALRSGEAANPRLLSVLVDQQDRSSPAPSRVVVPPTGLDTDQQRALDRALSSPDLMLLLGPPGTGKTTTIVEIARALVARGERVLISSQTNTAVDNALERMPPDIRSVRVGGEARISPRVSHLSVSALVTDVRKGILDQTAVPAADLSAWTATGVAVAWSERLSTEVAGIGTATAQRTAAIRDRDAALATVRDRHAARTSAAVDAVRRTREESRRLTDLLATTTASKDRAVERSHGVLGFYYRRRTRRLEDALGIVSDSVRAAALAHLAAQREFTAVEDMLDRAGRAEPAVRAALSAIAVAETSAAAAFGRAKEACEALYPLLAVCLSGVTLNSASVPGILAFHRNLTVWLPVLGRRAVLLDQWRCLLADPGDDLNHELVRYADVVGATCIGAGIARNLIADHTFDVAIIDEAAQIALPSTLVPLVRARRSVLVGDHHQLPPFVDEEVDEWLNRNAGREHEPGALRGLLTISAFERLYRGDRGRGAVALLQQRRMPKPVSDFVSRHFYDDSLLTRCERSPITALFTSCLALIDTSDLPPRERAEQRRHGSETWHSVGYENPAEARLIVDLVQWYAGLPDRNWAVIVPYRAQAAHLRLRLTSMLGDERQVVDSVGTVDAFQGGERDIVLYGFTRSNAEGNVGFLRELRRLNVAITRARHQLVLIGDFRTLRNSRDAGFAALAADLYRHAVDHGEVQSSRTTRARLRTLSGGPS
ncbi:AAA domain-containing protein [Cryptosporangium sp. NPDC051539]|uniref:AAA domain-containing protein n=1 Tax=Cryptosporangium sp. NPDC051539 TaxID=3363962 RepID=UPI00378D27AE